MPIVGSFAGASSRAYGLQAGVQIGDYESIASVTLSGSTNIQFSSIPQTYTHLQIRGILRTDRANTEDVFKMRFNSDTTETNYYNHYITGDGSVTGSYAQNLSWIGVTSSNTSTAQIQGAIILDILDYTNTSKYKTSRALTGNDRNGAGQIWLSSQLWKNTAAITTINFIPNSGTNFMQYSSLALYGIKG